MLNSTNNTIPFSILGVNPSASGEEIDAAYQRLYQNYHCAYDAYAILTDIYDQTWRQIELAYDTIQREKEGTALFGRDTQISYSNIRSLIVNHQMEKAEELLNCFAEEYQGAEWHFLKGSIYYINGYLEEAFQQIQAAYTIEPNSIKYQTAVNSVGEQWQEYRERVEAGNISKPIPPSYSADTFPKYNGIRSLIQNNQGMEAEQLLNSFRTECRDAEWYFLKGSIFCSRDWLEEAYQQIQTAYTMEKENTKYHTALVSIRKQMEKNRKSNNISSYSAYQIPIPNSQPLFSEISNTNENPHPSYSDIRFLLQNKRKVEAESILDHFSMGLRKAEWYFLRGCVYYINGSMEEAYQHVLAAHTMAPENSEYKKGLTHIKNLLSEQLKPAVQSETTLSIVTQAMKKSADFNSATETPQNSYSDIRSLMKSNHELEAEQKLKDVPIDCRNAEWHFLKGSICYIKGDLEEAYEQIQTACIMSSENIEYQTLLSCIRQLWQERQKNLQAEEASPAAGMSAQLRVEDLFEPVGYTFPTCSDIRFLMQGHQTIEAENLLDSFPKGRRDAEWYFLKGSLLSGRGLSEEAYHQIQTACIMDSENIEYQTLLNCLAQIHLEYKADTMPSESTVDSVPKESYDATVYTSLNYSELRAMIQNHQESEAESILAGFPDVSRDAEWHYLYGRILFSKGQGKEAYIEVFAAYNMEPENKDYKDALDFIGRQQSDCKPSIKSDSSTSHTAASKGRSLPNLSRIRILIRNNRLAEAEHLLNKFPNGCRDAEWHFLKGNLYYEKGWLEEAYQQVKTASNMSPRDMEYKSVLSRMIQQRQNMSIRSNQAPFGRTIN